MFADQNSGLQTSSNTLYMHGVQHKLHVYISHPTPSARTHTFLLSSLCYYSNLQHTWECSGRVVILIITIIIMIILELLIIFVSFLLCLQMPYRFITTCTWISAVTDPQQEHVCATCNCSNCGSRATCFEQYVF